MATISYDDATRRQWGAVVDQEGLADLPPRMLAWVIARWNAPSGSRVGCR
ncbi:hypothetical protein [Actinopolyspora erythraea]|nr:hypothetical protein [Actinopolyspora erythraea]